MQLEIFSDANHQMKERGFVTQIELGSLRTIIIVVNGAAGVAIFAIVAVVLGLL